VIVLIVIVIVLIVLITFGFHRTSYLTINSRVISRRVLNDVYICSEHILLV